MKIRRYMQEMLIVQFAPVYIFFFMVLYAGTVWAQNEFPRRPDIPPNVLIINSYSPGYTWSDEVLEGVLFEMEAYNFGAGPIICYLDSRRFPDPRREDWLLMDLEFKCFFRPPDLIITIDNAAFDFVQRHRERLGASIPVVFGGLNHFLPEMIEGQENITGVAEQSDYSGTFELIEHLCPKAKHILVLSNQGESGIESRRNFESFAPQHEDRYDFTYYDDWTNEELFARVASLPKDWVGIILDVTTDVEGTINFNNPEFSEKLSSSTHVPIFLTSRPPGDTDWSVYSWDGVGGGMIIARDHGEAVGKIAQRVLDGEDADAIPVIRYSPQRLEVDYRQLKKFGLDEKKLPPNTHVINAPNRFFEIHRTRLILAGLIIIVLIVIIMVLSVNILQRRRAEEALLTAQEQLRSAQKMEAIGLLAGGIAHDFNNILQIIGGHASLIREDVEDDPELLENAEIIQGAAERAADLTRQLLAFSRKQMLQAKRFDPNAMVEEMAKMLRRVLGTHIDLQVFPYYVEPLSIVADKGQIEQVILNLCLNARDAMPNGGQIKLMVGCRKLEDSDSHAVELAPGDYLELIVRDNGRGMSDDVIERLFEPFFTTKGLGQGTGMGLAVVYGIIKQHNGTITVSSVERKGSEFTILLPLNREESKVESSDVVADIPRGSGTILLAEDDPDVRKIGVQVLKRAGYDVLEALDGVEAKALIDQHHAEIRLAILDVIMPRCNGRQVYEYLTTYYDDIPVLFSSGYSADMLPPEIAPEAGTALINKPYSAQELLPLVYRMLKK
ncbi:MAG: response regulator [Pontiellaceae bacterium]|nr:response regulator [Pontiellaceae bacterium]